jgi:hypothetical protein
MTRLLPAADQPGDDFAIRMTGSVTKVSEDVISPEIFSVKVA